MRHRRQFIARNQTSLQECVRLLVGQDKPENVKSVQTYIYNNLPPYHFQVHAEVGKELYRRVYVEYDERLASLQHDLMDYKVAFVREGRLLADTQWQHHRFSIEGQGPEVAACALAGHIRRYFADLTIPEHANVERPVPLQLVQAAGA